MQKIFRRYFVVVMFLVCLLIFGMDYAMLTISMRSEAVDNSLNEITQVSQMVASSQVGLKEVKSNLKEDYLTRCRTFAYFVKMERISIQDSDSMSELCTMLNVDELNVTDASGIVIYSSNEKNIGLDFNAYSQTQPFMALLDGTKENVVQDVQARALDNKLYQYVGVQRLDCNGIIQIGMSPERAVRAEEKAQTGYVFDYIPLEEGQMLFAADKETGEILSDTIDDFNGQSLYDNGYDKSELKAYEDGAFISMSGTKYFCVMKEFNGTLIGIRLTKSALYRGRTDQMFVVAVFLTMLFSMVLYLVNALLEDKVVSGIYNLIDGLHEIENGNLNENIRMEGNREFEQLSRSINSMVHTLVNSTGRLERVMELVDTPVAAFEYSDDSNRVLTTEHMSSILGLEDKRASELYINKNLFNKYIDEIRNHPEPEEEDIYIYNRNGGRQWLKIIVDDEESGRFGLITDVTQEMEDKKHLRRERDIDPLTDIYNRRTFAKKVGGIITNSQNIGCAAMVMIDVDKFKGINDKYGHGFGDKYLLKLAGYLKSIKRDNVLIGRRSGDEFFVFFHHFEQKEDIENILDDFYNMVNNDIIEFPDGLNGSMGLSAGVAWYDKECSSFADLLNKSDQKLYMAKGAGRGHFES